MNLDERIRAMLKEQGGDLVGFADVTDLPVDMTGGLPAGAIVGSNWIVGAPRELIYDAFACRDIATKLSGKEGIESTICGICINSCPWTEKYVSCELDASR